MKDFEMRFLQRRTMREAKRKYLGSDQRGLSASVKRQHANRSKPEGPSTKV